MEEATVLLVDDNDDLRSILQDLLQDVGLPVCSKRKIEEAISYLRSGAKVKFALIDLYPMNSKYLNQLKILRQEYPEIVVVGMSGSVAREDQEKALSCDLHGLVFKPFRIEEVLKVYQDVSRNRS